MKKWIIATVIVAFTLGAYTYFGGFNEVNVVKLDSASFHLQGKLYKGSAKKAAMGKCFSTVDSVLKSQQSPEKLTAYFYNAPVKENDYAVEVFIGATYSGGEKLEADYEVMKFEVGGCIRSQHKSHPMITGVYSGAFAFAEDNEIKLDSEIAVEQYITRDSLVLWVPILP